MSEHIQFLGRSTFLNAQKRRKLRKLLTHFADIQGFIIKSLVYVHQTDDELLVINQEHLSHDDYTDIITFDLSDEEDLVDGEVYISIERVRENSILFGVDFWEEYIRVLSHGLFHLMGYKDKDEVDIIEMRKKEQEAILYFKEHLEF
jgi:probable rRNA maturation factor